MGDDWSEYTSDEIKGKTRVIIPLGSIEQHGKHLPLKTDFLIGSKIAEAVSTRTNIPFLPWFLPTASSEHQGFPGTLSLKESTLARVLGETCKELSRNGVKEIIIINSHGGNTGPLKKISGSGISIITYWELCNLPIQHADEIETSLVMYLAPSLVRKNKIVDGPPTIKWHTDVKKQAPLGVVGTPTKASKEYGEKLFNQIVSKITKTLM